MSYRIAGIDVHKKMLAVVVSDVEIESDFQFERRMFGSNPEQLRSLAAWLLEQEAEEVVMESTAQYWKPVWEALERYWKPICETREGARRKSGTSHLAQALFEKGYVRTYDDAFDTLIAKDSPAYVARVGLDPFEAVALVRKHGGVPSLAHPGTVVGLEELLPKLVAAGLAGIEAYYGEHSPEITARYLARAREFDLVPTGGSDFHGRGAHGADLGGVFVPPETIERLESRRRGT